MAEAVRRLSTYEQRWVRSYRSRELYFAALEMLRTHNYRVLIQVAKIAQNIRRDEAWQIEAYKRPVPALPDQGSA